MTQQHPPHWGDLDESMLDETDRYDRFRLAFHIAGHHWEAWRGNHPLRAAGLDIATSAANYAPERVPGNAMAAAILIEALSMEWHIHCVNGLMLDDFDDVDTSAVGEHVLDSADRLAECGCRREDPMVLNLLASPWWVEGAIRAALDDWPGIVALANVLGHGHVLEGDQVEGLLRLT